MVGNHAGDSLGVRWLLVLAFGVALLAGAAPAHADAAPGEQPGLIRRLLGPVDRMLVPRCLTPAVDRVFEEAVKTGAFQQVLGNAFTLERLDARGNEIELVIQDAAHRSAGITLALEGSKGGTPEGHGQHFQFFLAGSPGPANPDATTALLAAAALLDQAMPETAIVACSAEGDARDQTAGAEAPNGEPHGAEPIGGEKRYPRALALASAGIELAVLLAAILFGLRAIRSHDSDR